MKHLKILLCLLAFALFSSCSYAATHSKTCHTIFEQSVVDFSDNSFDFSVKSTEINTTQNAGDYIQFHLNPNFNEILLQAKYKIKGTQSPVIDKHGYYLFNYDKVLISVNSYQNQNHPLNSTYRIIQHRI